MQPLTWEKYFELKRTPTVAPVGSSVRSFIRSFVRSFVRSYLQSGSHPFKLSFPLDRVDLGFQHRRLAVANSVVLVLFRLRIEKKQRMPSQSVFLAFNFPSCTRKRTAGHRFS